MYQVEALVLAGFLTVLSGEVLAVYAGRIINLHPSLLPKFGGEGNRVAKELQELTGLESRCTILGYMQRGGTPTAYDRVLSTKYGAKAVELAMEGKFGVLTVIKNGKLDCVPLEVVVGEN